MFRVTRTLYSLQGNNTVFSDHRMTKSVTLHAASVAKQQISLTQGVGVMTTCISTSPHGKRSSPGIFRNNSF